MKRENFINFLKVRVRAQGGGNGVEKVNGKRRRRNKKKRRDNLKVLLSTYKNCFVILKILFNRSFLVILI